MTPQPSPDLAALSELLEKLTAYTDSFEGGIDYSLVDHNSMIVFEMEDWAALRNHVPALIALASRVPELEAENAALRAQTGWPDDMPLCKHGVGIFGDRIKCPACEAEKRIAELEGELATMKGYRDECERQFQNKVERVGQEMCRADSLQAQLTEANTTLKTADGEVEHHRARSLTLQRAIESLQAQLAEAKGELAEAEAKGWRDAVSAVQYMEANWYQDCRSDVERKALADAAASIIDELVTGSPGEWLGTQWLSVQQWQAKLGAERTRADSLQVQLDEAKGEINKLVAAIGEHITVRSEYLARAEAAEARANAAEKRVKGLDRASIAEAIRDNVSCDIHFDLTGVDDAVIDILALLPPAGKE